jgi:D-arabinan endo alpha-(1,5)-arabinofuranosidase
MPRRFSFGIGRGVGRSLRPREPATSALPLLNGKVVDLTGPNLTDRWGVTCTDLGASVTAPNGKLVSVFGDTFSGRKVGEGDWRSPVVLIGEGDANHEIVYERAGGDDPDYARQLWHYIHDDASTGWKRGGISTVIPSDLLTVDDSIYLHAIVNRGFGTVIWTEIWRSDDNGITWTHMGEQAKFPADLHDGYAQCWSWDYEPDDGWVYVVATGFQRNKGIILMRVRPEHIGERSRYLSWGFTGERWTWGARATPITPDGEEWGELTFRRMAQGKWILGGFMASKYALAYRVVDSPVANMHTTPLQLAVTGSSWRGENHLQNRVAQLYGGYVLPGSRFDMQGGFGLVVSQWNTDTGWPYRAMQFKAALRDTTKSRRPPDPIDL